MDAFVGFALRSLVVNLYAVGVLRVPVLANFCATLSCSFDRSKSCFLPLSISRSEFHTASASSADQPIFAIAFFSHSVLEMSAIKHRLFRFQGREGERLSPPHALLGGEVRLALILDTLCQTVNDHLTHQRGDFLIGRISDSGHRLHQCGHGVLLALVSIQERLDVGLDTLVCQLGGSGLLIDSVLAVEQFQLVVQEARHISTGNLDSGITLGNVIGGVHIHLGQNGGEVVALGQTNRGSSSSHSINPFCVFRCRPPYCCFPLGTSIL